MLSLTASFSLYFFSLLMFSFFSHPVYYCCLLVFNALICSFIGFTVIGFGWYSLIFCLVYVGGVYILFIFVSVYSPNNNLITPIRLNWGLLWVAVIGVVVGGFIWGYLVSDYEFSGYLCTSNEGLFYVCLCLMLVFGFFILSMIMSAKFNYYR